MIFKILACFGLIAISRAQNCVDKFPSDFKFGAATAAYQVEGAWNTSGKGPNIWDDFTHQHPERISDRSNGDVAMDSYHLYDKDIAALEYLGANTYRFSLSWSRLLPTGFVNVQNPDGIRYYNTIIDTLLAKGIEPIVTLYHWDLPSPLQSLGGWTSRDIIPFYLDYVQFVWKTFGDRVKTWITFNEINVICPAGYARTSFAPGLGLPGRAEYMCAHNMILANAYAYRLYKTLPSSIGGGKVGFVQQVFGYYPLSNSKHDIDAANLGQTFSLGWILDPIFNGDYPEEMKTIIRQKSLAENFTESRLPEFTREEMKVVKGSADFVGVNHYTSFVFTYPCDPILDPNYATPLTLTTFANSDFPVRSYRLTEWPYGDFPLISIVPEGFRDALLYITKLYRNPAIIITECGFPYNNSGPNLNDLFRVDYIKKYINAVLQARRLGSNVFGYIQWSLEDNFEWASGYTQQFGLYHVDHTSTDKLRTCRLSCEVYKNIVATKTVDFSYLPDISNPKSF